MKKFIAMVFMVNILILAIPVILFSMIAFVGWRLGTGIVEDVMGSIDE